MKALSDEFDKTIEKATEADLSMKAQLNKNLSIFDESISTIENVKQNTEISTLTDDDINNNEATFETMTSKLTIYFKASFQTT